MLSSKPVFRIAQSSRCVCMCVLVSVISWICTHCHTKEAQLRHTHTHTSQIFTPLDDFWFEQIYRNQCWGVKILKFFAFCLDSPFVFALHLKCVATTWYPVSKFQFSANCFVCASPTSKWITIKKTATRRTKSISIYMYNKACKQANHLNETDVFWSVSQREQRQQQDTQNRHFGQSCCERLISIEMRAKDFSLNTRAANNNNTETRQHIDSIVWWSIS